MTTWRRGLVYVAALVTACGGASNTDLNDTGSGPGTDGGGVTEGGGGPDGGGPPGSEGGVVDSGMPLVCATGTADCDGHANNGCETNILADDGHCGGCKKNDACNSGDSCQAGKCVKGPATIVPTGTFAVSDSVCLALDATSIYISSGRPAGDVYRVSKAGGAPVSIAMNLAIPRGIATDANNVFWSENSTGVVTKADPDGKNPKAMNAATAAAGANTVSVDAQGVYWGNNLVGTISRADKNGTNEKQLVPGAAGVLGQGHITAITSGGGYVYYADFVNSEVMRVPNDGSAAPSLVASNITGARTVALNGNTVLIGASGNTGQVFSVAASGPPAVPVQLATNQGMPVSIVTDGTAVYWANGVAAGTIMKKDGGGAATPIVTAQPFPACMAVDGSSVYWINESAQSVMRAAK